MTKQMSFCDEDCETSSTLVRDGRGGGEGARQHVGEPDDARPADGDHGDFADGGEGFDAAADLRRARR